MLSHLPLLCSQHCRPQALLVRAWRQPDNFAETAVKVALVTEACGIGCLYHASALLEQPLRFSDPALHLKLVRCQTAGRLELANHMIRADSDTRCHVRN